MSAGAACACLTAVDLRLQRATILCMKECGRLGMGSNVWYRQAYLVKNGFGCPQEVWPWDGLRRQEMRYMLLISSDEQRPVLHRIH